MSATTEPTQALTVTEKKHLVVRALLHQAGNLVEFWGDMGAEGVDGEFARDCLARWLKDLPGDNWDSRLEPPRTP